MILPFTADQFLSLFAEYNEAVWPMQFVANAAGAAAVASIVWRRRELMTPVTFTAALWFWSAFVYFATVFAPLSAAGYVFTALFAVEGLLLLRCALDTWVIERPGGHELALGALLLTYALVLYPIIGALAGQRYPATSTFGLPCPTTIFTFGMVCVFARSLPLHVLFIPIVWSFLATWAAAEVHVPQDFALPFAAIIATSTWIAARVRHERVTRMAS